MANGLEIDGLTRPGLTPVSVSVAAGEGLAVRGPSGSGKSLFLRAVADLDPNEGTVRLGGDDRGAMPAPDWRRRVAYLHTEAGWWAESVAPHFADWGAAAPLAERFGLPAAAGDWPVTRLSTGERQRLALVRVLVQEPEALLLDEPTSALDADSAASVESVLLERLRAGAVLLFATHDAGQAKRLGARTLSFDGGRARLVDDVPAGEAGP